MRHRGVKTESPIEDLNVLAPWPTRRTSSSKIKTLHDTWKTADLSNNSASSDGSCLMNPSGDSMGFKEANNSFSDLTKERPFHSIQHCFESFFDFEASFTGSDGSLEWAEGDAFPKSKSSSTTTSTCSSTVDLSAFVVLSAFQLEPSVADRQPGQDSSDESEDQEEEEEEEEECPRDHLDLSTPDKGGKVLAPSPRDSTRVRRASVLKRMEQSRHDQEAVATFCRNLARSDIDTCKTPRRARTRLSFTVSPSPLQHRHSSDRSAATENDVDGLKQCRLQPARAISRRRRGETAGRSTTASSSGPHRLGLQTGRERSISRDRSTATAPTTLLPRTRDRRLLGKVVGDESEEEADRLWFAHPQASVRRRRPSSARVRETDQLARGSSSRGLGSETAVNGNPERRRRHASDGAPTPRTRRSVRPTRSGDLRVPKRSSMTDFSTRSDPVPQTVSLDERLHNLGLTVDASARSNPERSRPMRHSERRFDTHSSLNKARRSKSSKTTTLLD